MVAEEVEVERGLGGEGMLDIAVEVAGDESATIVRAERYFATRIGGDGAVAEVGITVGHALADDGVPEHHTGLGRSPGVVDDFVPEGAGVDFLGEGWCGGVDGILLHEGLAAAHALHELVGNLNGDIGTGDLALFEFGIDELLGIGVLDIDREHEGSAATALCHLAGGVAVAFHEGDDAGGGEGAILDRAAGGTDMGEVVADAAAAFHELHLLLVDLHNAAVGVAGAAVADDEAVGEGDDLEVVADAGHGAALRDDVLEILQEPIDGLL